MQSQHVGGSSSRCCSWQFTACPAMYCSPLLTSSPFLLCSFHSPVCCWLWPCHALCIASFAAFCGRQAAALRCPPLSPSPLFAQSCPLVRPYAKQLQRQQLLRSWLLHCKCECDSESETATSMTTTTTTVSDAECNLSKKKQRKWLQHSGAEAEAEQSRAETTLCFGINMSAIKLICVAYG